MIKPRNTLVLVRLVLKAEEKVGLIHIPQNSEQFAEAEVIAVGPDCISATGGQSATHDLKPGQRVLVQHQVIQKQGVQSRKIPKGLLIKESVAGERDLYFFEQTYIMAILAEPKDIKQENE